MQDGTSSTIEDTREEHVAWAKTRAREFLENGDWLGAWDSFFSDMLKHESTRRHPDLLSQAARIVDGHSASVEAMREFLDDFK